VKARGTSELGELGMIVGDPLVARVKRDLKGVNVRGYPVQVSACRADNSLSDTNLRSGNQPQLTPRKP
jgi:hypothetical protein